MNIFYPSKKVYAAASPLSGLGVFAKEDITQGEIIEECPIIEIEEAQLSDLTKTKLFDYYFAWGSDYKSAAVCLGFGSLYNHSYTPSAKYVKEIEDKKIVFIALKNIKRDEEILVNYNGNPEDQTKIWFEARESR